MNSPLIARLAGNWARAGDLYYQQGRLILAAQMYEKAGMNAEAARLFAQSGDVPGAVRLLVEVGDRREAARLLEKAGQLREAITQYEAAGALWDAAELAARARMPAAAARLFERAGNLDRAASLFENAGELPEALRVLERESRRISESLRSGRADGSTKADLRRVDLHRGELLARLRRLDEAIELLGRHGAHARVAELLDQLGATDRAALAFLEAGQPEKALRLLPTSELTHADKGRIYRANHLDREAAECFETAGMRADAAECYEHAGLGLRAAALWEEAGETKRAADLYFREKRWADARRCFEAVGDLDAAVTAALAADDPSAAAELLFASERWLEAAESAIAADRPELASAALQHVGDQSPDFERATMLLVPLLIEEGFHDAALARLEMLPDEAERTGPLRAERSYWEARALEAAGRIEEAARAYEQVVAVNRGLRDVTARLRALRDRLTESGSSRSDTGASTVRLERFDPTAALAPGASLAGRYEVRREIGHGGMARVYEAYDRELRELVAIKTLLIAAGDAVADQERLLREVQISRRITHPNVVRVYDIGRFPGGIFVTMELLRGRTLDAIVKQDGPQSLAVARSLGVTISDALDAAHRLKVVHRDLKPGNVVVQDDGQTKILDFGIARADDHDVSLTGTGEVMGSPMYMAPEQLCGEPIDGRADLYALGVLLFTVVTGREPFQGKTASAIALKHLQEDPPDPQELRADLPDEWATLILRLLRKKPAERFADAATVSRQIAALPG